MRDWLISRQRYWGAPIPIIHCPEHGAVAVPEKDLPVILPEVENYQPDGSGTGVLAQVKDWVQTTCPTCGGAAERETDTMDGYACSSWYFLRYLDPHNSEVAWTKDHAAKWMPVDFYNGGDHAIAHLLYARFFMRFFHKLGLVDTPEPFKRMYYHAKIMAHDGTAFSKTKGNGPDPLKLIDAGYGADSIRTYIMFISPPDVESPWNEEGVPGCYRFLQRIWNLTQEFMVANPDASTTTPDILPIIHRTIKKVSHDIEHIKFNTAIAAMMECVNDLYKIKATSGYQDAQNWRFALESLLELVAPFAPHLAEELWHELGQEDSIHIDHWPLFDEEYLVKDTITIVVQINGKLRATLMIGADSDESTITAAAHADTNVLTHLAGKEVVKTIYIPGKLVNFVIK